MEDVLSFLSSYTNPWLSFDPTFLDTDPNYTPLSTVILLLVFLWYLLLKPFLPTFWKNEDIQKHQGRTKKRRRGRRRKGQRTSQREHEEERKLLSILKSPLGQYHDITHFRQLLCPDPLCDICNTTTAEASCLFSRAPLEDAVHTMSRLPSMNSGRKSSFTQTSAISAVPPGHPIPASLTEPSLHLPSILSPNQVTPLVHSQSPSLQGDSVPLAPDLPLDSKTPVAHFLLEPVISPLPPPHHTQEAEPVLQPGATLSPDDGSGDLSTNSLSSAEPSLWEHSTAYHVEPKTLGFLSPDIQGPLERGIKKTDDLLMGKEKKKETDSFAKEHEPDYPLRPLGTSSEAAVDQQRSPLSLPFGTSKGKPKEMHMNEKPEGPETSEAHLQQNHGQFCHLPGLPIESLNPLVPASGDCFSAISSIFEARESPDLPHTSPLSLPEAQPPPLSRALPQSPSQRVCLPTEAQDQLPSLAPILSDSPGGQIRSYGMCSHSPQSEVQSLTLSETHSLEYNVLQKTQEGVWGLSSMVQNSRENLCPPAPKLSSATQSSRAHVPISILPGDSTFDSELWKKPEHHLQKRLTQHRGGLLPRVLKSLSAMCPQRQVPEDTSLDTHQAISLLSSSRQKMLEEHIKTFQSRTMQGLPHKVQKSIEIFNQKQPPLQDSFPSKILSSNLSVSRVDSKAGVSKTLRRSSDASPGDKMRTTNSAVDHPLPTTSPAGKERQKALTQSSSSTNYELTGNIQTREGATQTFLLPTYNSTGIVSPKQTLQTKRDSQKSTMTLAGAAHEVRDKRMTSGNDTERLHSKMTAKLEYFPICNKSREILKGKELRALQAQSRDISTTSVLEGVLNTSKAETERPPTRTAAPQDLKSSASENQLLNEPVLDMESREWSQSRALPTERSPASSDLKTKTLVSHGQDASCGDMAASQVMHVRTDKAKGIVGQGQQPRAPHSALHRCQDETFPAAGRVRPPAVKAGELCRGPAGLGTYLPQDRTLKGTFGSQSSPVPPLQAQPPLESLFKSKMQHFRQWLCPSIRYDEGKEGSSVRVRAASPGNSPDQKFSWDSAMVSGEKPQLTCAIDVAGSSSAFHPSRRLEKNSTRQRGPYQGHRISDTPSCSTMTNVKFYSKAPGRLDQRYYTRNRPRGARDGQPPRDIPCDDHEHPIGQLHRAPVPCPQPSRGPSGDQGPLAAHITAKGMLSESFSLLLEEKILLQHFEARTVPNLSLIKNTD